MPYARSSGPRRPRVETSQDKFKTCQDQVFSSSLVNHSLKFQDKHELHEIMNMIASAMGAVFTLKASIDFRVRSAENAENATVCDICVSVPCVCPGSTEGFGMRFPSFVKV